MNGFSTDERAAEGTARKEANVNEGRGEERTTAAVALQAEAGTEAAEEAGRVAELERLVHEQGEALRAGRAAVEALHRRVRLDEALREAGAIDVPTARLLAEKAMGTDAEASVEKAVAWVTRAKPFLFETARPSATALAPAGAASAEASVEDAAARAAATGKARDVLRYLRLKRGG